MNKFSLGDKVWVLDGGVVPYNFEISVIVENKETFISEDGTVEVSEETLYGDSSGDVYSDVYESIWEIIDDLEGMLVEIRKFAERLN